MQRTVAAWFPSRALLGGSGQRAVAHHRSACARSRATAQIWHSHFYLYSNLGKLQSAFAHPIRLIQTALCFERRLCVMHADLRTHCVRGCVAWYLQCASTSLRSSCCLIREREPGVCVKDSYRMGGMDQVCLRWGTRGSMWRLQMR